MATGTGTGEPVRVTAHVRGHVQGVGFRWWAQRRMTELGLAGQARNLADGRVEVVVQGPRESCARLVELLREQPSTAGRPGRVGSVTERWSDAAGPQSSGGGPPP